MADARIRRQIALLAARLMYERQESEYFTAKRKAARQLGVEYRFRPKDLPSNAEIREQVQSLAQLYEGQSRHDNLKAMRLAALRMMRLLGHRAKQRLRESEHFEDLELLQEFDRAGRQPGANVCSVDQALEFIEKLAADWEDGS